MLSRHPSLTMKVEVPKMVIFSLFMSLILFCLFLTVTWWRSRERILLFVIFLTRLSLMTRVWPVAPQWDRPFVLHVDASDVGAGAVLFQQDDDGVDRPEAGRWTVNCTHR
ncbi:uncharacterized protein LOC119792145 isoform X2 [Cyprinodon tularosa]|uniref:uncharacterized protein LOC119792145 isoform X2 n=1 Tax=Cyprinodon tularosa TaxID=77115 RepID=UPI0018E216F1|nr:uncharacterized protein LOC119792145 isoform X2 [Cyprinodon tularosa]